MNWWSSLGLATALCEQPSSISMPPPMTHNTVEWIGSTHQRITCPIIEDEPHEIEPWTVTVRRRGLGTRDRNNQNKKAKPINPGGTDRWHHRTSGGNRTVGLCKSKRPTIQPRQELTTSLDLNVNFYWYSAIQITNPFEALTKDFHIN